MKQEYKIEFKNTEVFFFAHSFKTAEYHMNDFISRNKGSFEMKISKKINYQWVYIKTIGVNNGQNSKNKKVLC